MSERHLADIRSCLADNGWTLCAVKDGNDHDVSGVWDISRGDVHLSIVFEGMAETSVLPIHKSYGCHIESDPKTSLYFARVGRSWPSLLSSFIMRIGTIG